MRNVTPALVVELLIQELGIPTDSGPDMPLFSSGMLESVDAVNMLLIIEKQFAVQIDPSTFDIAHFDTAESIAETIRRFGSKEAL